MVSCLLTSCWLNPSLTNAAVCSAAGFTELSMARPALLSYVRDVLRPRSCLSVLPDPLHPLCSHPNAPRPLVLLGGRLWSSGKIRTEIRCVSLCFKGDLLCKMHFLMSFIHKYKCQTSVFFFTPYQNL